MGLTDGRITGANGLGAVSGSWYMVGLTSFVLEIVDSFVYIFYFDLFD
jgi:hypothetical protein